MILTCPACGTQYVVKDGAIPEGGRKVRCASCRHSWHQDAPPLELNEEIAPEEPGQGDVYASQAVEPDTDYPMPNEFPDQSHQELGADAPEYGPDSTGSLEGDPVDYDRAAEETAEAYTPLPEDAQKPRYEPAAEPEPPADEPDDDFSPFAARDPVEDERRGPLAAILLVILVVATAAALFWFLAPPEWKARVGLADSRQTPLQLMMTHSDRQALASGNELLAVSGRIINPTTKTQQVPPIQAELRSKSGGLVYRWTIAPPTATLAPGASAPFNSAEVNVPAGGEELTVSLGAPSA